MTDSVTPAPAMPCTECALCPRLSAFRQANRAAAPAYFNAPVPSFGDLAARLLIVGLAPGMHGANQTGRPFTGDYAGDLLYATLLACGLAKGRYGRSRDDGLVLGDCRITNAVRCVPPANKPTPREVAACNLFLRTEIASMPGLRVILALGRVAHDAVLAARGLRRSAHAFAHGTAHPLSHCLVLVDSYHCSRYNTNTGRLTETMFRQAVDTARARTNAPSCP